MRAAALVALPVAVLLTATAAYAAGLTLTTTHLGAAAPTAPAMFPVSVTVANKSGGTPGKPQNGDIITIVYSQPIDASTLCSSWAPTLTSANVQAQWSIQNGVGGANDTLTVTKPPTGCTSFPVGVIDLGASGYNTSTTAIDFPTAANVLSVTSTTTTLTVTLNGQKNGTAGTVSSGSQATWTPSSAVTDRTGRNCGANLAKSTATVQF